MPGNPAYKQTVHRPFLKACRVSSVFHVVPLQEKTKNHYYTQVYERCRVSSVHTHIIARIYKTHAFVIR